MESFYVIIPEITALSRGVRTRYFAKVFTIIREGPYFDRRLLATTHYAKQVFKDRKIGLVGAFSEFCENFVDNSIV